MRATNLSRQARRAQAVLPEMVSNLCYQLFNAHCALVCNADTKAADLLSTAFLQPVYHLLKLQQADLHLLFQLVDKRIVVRVQVVVWLLCVQAESCREAKRRKQTSDESKTTTKKSN